MMGRYFAGFDEAPGRKLRLNHTIVNEYWGEGSNRTRNWQRYDVGGGNKKNDLAFEEGGAHDVMIKETRSASADE